MKIKITLILTTVAVLGFLVRSQAQITFTKVQSGFIAVDQGQFLRGVWGDFNDDGFLDLMVCNYTGTNVLYRNNGNRTFTKIIQGDPVQESDYHVASAIGDYDNDGFLDLLVSSGVGAPTFRRNMLYHNNGDGTFSRASGGGLTNQLGYFNAGGWADYDNDGFLDIFITDVGRTNELWHNEGDGTFIKITSGPPVNDLDAWGALWGDYDNDGFMDLFVTKLGNNVVNLLYHNNRDGTFTRILTNAITKDNWVSGSEIGAWGDYDNDGLQDLFVTGDNGSPNRLYHNNGNGAFTTITSAPIGSRPAGSDSLGCAWGDYDNDGYLDLFVTTHNAHNALFHNNGNGTFTQILAGVPVNDGGPEYSFCGWVDYDNDGFLDLSVTRNNSLVPSISNFLYRNNGNSNAWLEVRLVGTASNRSAIGAKVHAHASIGGNSFWQLREINGGGGRWMQPLTAHFGLGDATNVDMVRIEWPSGIVQTLNNVATNHILTVVEHQEAGAVTAPSFTSISGSADGLIHLSVAGDTGLLYLFEASTDLAKWSWLGVRSNATGGFQFVDSRATNYPVRFYRVSIP